MGEEKSLVHFLHQQADSLSWFKVHSPILFSVVLRVGGDVCVAIGFFFPLQVFLVTDS
jgi:hypothetical protein